MNDISCWKWTSDGSDSEAWKNDLLGSWDRWKSLAPFFASHQLYLYEYIDLTLRFARPPAFPKSGNSPSEQYPWARNSCKKEEDLDYNYLQVGMCAVEYIF